MSKNRNALKAGIFIVGSTLLTIVVIVSIHGAGLGEPTQTRTVSFSLADDLSGLRVGDDVRLGGFRAGLVTAIEPANLDGKDGTEPRLMVTFQIPTRFPLRHDARVRMQVTLTGSPSLNIESLGAGAPLADGELMVGKPDPKTVALAALGAAGDDVAAITKDVRNTTLPRVNAAVDAYRQTGEGARALVASLGAKVDPAAAKYHAVADKAGGAMDSVREFLGPTTTDFKGTMANLNAITGGVKEKLPAMLQRVDTSLQSAQKALEDIQATVANTRDTTATLREVIGGNRGKLDAIIGSLKTTGDNLKAASVEIRHSPWRLLYKPQAGEVANLTVYDSARQFAEGASELNDASKALRDAMKMGEKDPAELQKLINRLEKSFQQFRQVEDKLWTDVRE